MKVLITRLIKRIPWYFRLCFIASRMQGEKRKSSKALDVAAPFRKFLAIIRTCKAHTCSTVKVLIVSETVMYVGCIRNSLDRVLYTQSTKFNFNFSNLPLFLFFFPREINEQSFETYTLSHAAATINSDTLIPSFCLKLFY